MSIQVKKATKKQTKAKVGIAGPAGAGKTYTMLKLAMEMASSPEKVLVIDTEHGSAEKYSDVFPGWDTIQPTRFDLIEAVEFIDYAVEKGYEVLGFDSGSHYWAGQGGALESVGGVSSNWRVVTPKWERFVDKIVSSKIHLIFTMRAKMAYSFEKNDKGKVEPQRIGIQPVMRDDVEYIFDVYGLLDQNNILSILKSRATPHIIIGSTWPQPGKEFADRLKAFCSDGVEDRFVLPVEIRDKFNDLRSKVGEEAFDKLLVESGYQSLLAIPSTDDARRIYSAIVKATATQAA